MLLSHFFDEHFTPVYLARCKKRTVDLYRQILNLWIGEIDDLELSEITLLEKLIYHVPWYQGTVSDLARMLGVARNTATKAVTKLVKLGLVNKVKYGT